MLLLTAATALLLTCRCCVDYWCVLQGKHTLNVKATMLKGTSEVNGVPSLQPPQDQVFTTKVSWLFAEPGEKSGMGSKGTVQSSTRPFLLCAATTSAAAPCPAPALVRCCSVCPFTTIQVVFNLVEGKGDAPGAVEPSDTKAAAKPADPKAAPGEKPAAAAAGEEAEKPAAAEGDAAAAAAAPAEGEAKPGGEKKKGPGGGAVNLLAVCMCMCIQPAAAAAVLSSVASGL